MDFNASVQNETANITKNVSIPDAKKEILVFSIEIVIDNNGLVRLKETMSIPVDNNNKGELLVGEDFLVPDDVKDSLKNSLLIFYELGKQKLNFDTKIKDSKETITISFPGSVKNGETQTIRLEYTTYQFTSTSSGVGTLRFSSLPVTPGITIISIKFPDKSNIILNSLTGIPDSVADISSSSGNELMIRPKVDRFNLTGKYYLPPPSPPEDNKISDREPPVVALKSPENNMNLTAETATGNVTFKYSAEDASGIKNCELIINTETRGLSDNVTLKDNEFTINLGTGTYVWAVRCRDNSLNENSGSSESRNLIISQKTGNDTLMNFIFNIFKSEYGISLLIASVLIIYLTFAYFKRGKKHASSGGEPDLEDLYPSEEKKSVENEKKRKINQSIMKLMDESEQKVINILIDSGETTQANVYKITQIPKATLSNIMRKLEERNIIERRVEGKVKWVKLKDWVFE